MKLDFKLLNNEKQFFLENLIKKITKTQIKFQTWNSLRDV